MYLSSHNNLHFKELAISFLQKTMGGAIITLDDRNSNVGFANYGGLNFLKQICQNKFELDQTSEHGKQTIK